LGIALKNARDSSESPFDPLSPRDELSSISDFHVSMSHPNIKGAARYASVINGIIDSSISLPRNV
jgi:hypothetical protein